MGITHLSGLYLSLIFITLHIHQNHKTMNTERGQTLDRQSNTQRIAIIILALLLLVSIIGNVIYMGRSSRLGDEKQQLLTERTQLQQLNSQLNETIDARDADIQQLNTQISEMEEQHAATIADKDARIASLNRRANTRASELEAEQTAHKELKEQHQELTELFETLNKEYQDLHQEFTMLQQTHNQLLAKSQEAEGLNVYNICTLTKWERWICADRYNVTQARRVNTTFIGFEVDGSIFATAGNKNIHLIMYDPTGNVMYPEQDIFDAEDGSQMSYTMMQQINYNHAPVGVEFTVIHPERLDPGSYQIEIYVDGKLSRSSEILLD